MVFIKSGLKKLNRKRHYYNRKYRLYLLKHWLHDDNKNGKLQKISPAIDVFIPTLERDIEVLKYTVLSLRKYSNNEIGKIYIISPHSELIDSFAAQNDCVYVLEDTVPAISKKDIVYNVNGNDRSGWLYQQILKLNWNKVSDKKYCLVFDSDTILVKPQTFVQHSKIIFNCSDQHHLPYYQVFKSLFSYYPKFPLSFVSHYMVFERESTLKLKQEIEIKTGLNWEKAILSVVNYKDIAGFSEYETYGHFMYTNFRKAMIINYSYNKSFNKSDFSNISSIIESSRSRYKSISFHWYNQQ